MNANHSRVSISPWLLLVLATVMGLAPFCGKAFHIDDPLFLWAAQHIQSHPADPYGFTVNWYGARMPMAEVTKNPPLDCYFIAWAARLVGWSEAGLHLVFLLPALGVILGTYSLARQCCRHPLIAALTVLVSPVFLLCGTSVMCDIPMLAFWVWAVALWVRGLEKNEVRWLAVAAGLVGLSALTKYYGMCLIPLLAVYAALKQRALGWWTLCLLVPLAMLAWYQHATHALYGRGLLLDAADYATATRAKLGATVDLGMVPSHDLRVLAEADRDLR